MPPLAGILPVLLSDQDKNTKPHPSIREMGSPIRLSLVQPSFHPNRPCPPVSFGCRW